MNGSHETLRNAYQALLPLVEKPTRYVGAERGTYRKDLSRVDVRVALAFPDVYEIGQSHLGLQLLYDLLNRRPGIAAERVYAPWLDMEALLRERGLKLASLETFTPLDAFDIVGFSLQYELTYTNLITMLELGGIPVESAHRQPRHPLIIAGGPGAFNAEPIADFIDAFLLGDAEEAILELTAAYRSWDRRDRHGLLERLARVPGTYVPAFFEPRYHDDGSVIEIRSVNGHETVKKRVLEDLNDSPIPKQQVVPSMGVVHERPRIEVMRGCVKGCRFCQAGYIYRPQRERDPRAVVDEATRLVEETGHEELSLLSLSTGDYSCINPVLRELMNRFAPRRVAVSLPSTRVDAISPVVLDELRKGRKTGFTLAPEAGTQRMRDIIQKEYKEEELIEAARLIFGLGWRSLKLYFMLGLPGETEEDLLGIVDLCRKVRAVAEGRAEVTASVSTFVPKPHTPFQWAAQLDVDETHQRQSLLKRELGRHRIRFKWHDARLSFLEGIFSRGDRRLSRLLLVAQRMGCRFDGWTDQCRWDLWQEALARCGVDAGWYLRRRTLAEVLPWDHLFAGVNKKYLRQELARAVEGVLTPDCSIERCTYCGACDFQSLKNVSYHLSGAKGGRHQGAEIDPWARRRIPELDTWETKSWQEAQKRLTEKAARAARARGDSPNVSFLEAISLGSERHPGSTGENGSQGAGAAEEWLDSPESRLDANTEAPAAVQRIRVRYAKDGPARFIGARELSEVFYRVARRTRLAVAFTAGHHPLPRLSFSPGLPVGLASVSEFFDVYLTDETDPEVIAARLERELPEGLSLIDLTPVPLDATPLEPSIRAFRYEVDLTSLALTDQEIEQRVAAFARAAEFPVQKRRKRGRPKTVDARAIATLSLAGPRRLDARIDWSQQGTITPTLLLAGVLCLDDEAVRQLRITKLATLFREPETSTTRAEPIPCSA